MHLELLHKLHKMVLLLEAIVCFLVDAGDAFANIIDSRYPMDDPPRQTTRPRPECSHSVVNRSGSPMRMCGERDHFGVHTWTCISPDSVKHTTPFVKCMAPPPLLRGVGRGYKSAPHPPCSAGQCRFRPLRAQPQGTTDNALLHTL